MKGIGLILGLLGMVGLADAGWELYEPKEWVDVSAHLRVVGGLTSGDFEEQASHGHDPNRDFTLQGLEVGANVRMSDHVQGFAAVNLYRSLEDELEAEWEEGFLKFVDLPGGFEVRGGRYLNRFGRQNAVHLHGWDFVDANLVTSSFLGDEGLVTEGVELSWIWEGPVTSALSVSFGNAAEHSHDHGEEEHHEEEEEDEEEHEHGHGGEEAFWTDDLVTGRWLVRWQPSDFHRHDFGLNLGLGQNGYGEETRLWSGDYSYLWRENGLEPGGRYLEVGGEIYYRDVEWYDAEEAVGGEAGQWGLVATARYGFLENWEAGARFDWIEGVEDGPEDEVVFGVEERRRYSLALTRRFELAERFGAFARLQGNYDELEEGDEQSVFFQLGIDWGGVEIR